MEAADKLVCRAFEIIDYFQPKLYLIENPATGVLKTHPCVQHIPKPMVCNYCMYSDFCYRQNINLGSNLNLNVKTCDRQ